MDHLSLEKIINTYLETGRYQDVSCNGLQIEGRPEVNRIATAATASLEAIDAAVEAGADALIVHHGLFWKGASPRLVGVMHDRVATALAAGLNLYAYHLPLDAHAELGNNRLLMEMLGALEFDYAVPGDPTSVGMVGRLEEPLSVNEICGILCAQLDTRVQVIGNPPSDLLIEDVAVCSGAGSALLDDNPRPDFDALITGDVNEQTYHLAAETGTVVFAVGHHASEQDGVRCLGDYLAQKYGLEHIHLHFALEKSVPWYESDDSGSDE